MKSLALSLPAIFFFSLPLAAQFTLEDLKPKTGTNVLQTERSVDRPLTMHKGQLQVNAGYLFGVRSGSFDESGNRINLTKEGIASVNYSWMGEIRYGITGFLEIAAAMNYLNTGIRSKQVYIQSEQTYIYINQLTANKGLEDLLLSLSVRPFTKSKGFDMAFFGSLSLPTAKYKSPQPAHKAVITDPANGSMEINYVFNEKNGIGVLGVNAGTSLKIRFTKAAVILNGSYYSPLAETNAIAWNSRLVNTDFIYSSYSYKYKVPAELSFFIEPEYQPAGWFSLRLGSFWQQCSGGWSEKSLKRKDTPVTVKLILIPGYEIQVSPYLRIFQRFELPVYGKNLAIPFTITTGASFNFFL